MSKLSTAEQNKLLSELKLEDALRSTRSIPTHMVGSLHEEITKDAQNVLNTALLYADALAELRGANLTAEQLLASVPTAKPGQHRGCTNMQDVLWQEANAVLEWEKRNRAQVGEGGMSVGAEIGMGATATALGAGGGGMDVERIVEGQSEATEEKLTGKQASPQTGFLRGSRAAESEEGVGGVVERQERPKETPGEKLKRAAEMYSCCTAIAS